MIVSFLKKKGKFPLNHDLWDSTPEVIPPQKKKNAPGFTLREGHELGRPPPNPGDPSGGHVWKGPDFFRQNRGGSKMREPAAFEAPLKYPTKHPWCDCTQLHHLHASHNQPPLHPHKGACRN